MTNSIQVLYLQVVILWDLSKQLYIAVPKHWDRARAAARPTTGVGVGRARGHLLDRKAGQCISCNGSIGLYVFCYAECPARSTPALVLNSRNNSSFSPVNHCWEVLWLVWYFGEIFICCWKRLVTRSVDVLKLNLCQVTELVDCFNNSVKVVIECLNMFTHFPWGSRAVVLLRDFQIDLKSVKP